MTKGKLIIVKTTYRYSNISDLLNIYYVDSH